MRFTENRSGQVSRRALELKPAFQTAKLGGGQPCNWI